jgi:hypothetical protein
MLNFNLSISNPWSNRWKAIWYKNGLLSKHKAWEFNGYLTHQLLDINIEITTRQDHAGLHLMFGLIGFTVEFTIYDTRHWNGDVYN